MKIPHPDWTFLGSSLNCEGYEIRDDLIALVPRKDVRETKETALENLAFQKRHWDKVGHTGASIIFMDPIIEQDADARGMYMAEAGNVGSVCFALIGETTFANATSAIYTGLARPSVPIRVFQSLEEALPWIDETIANAKS